MKKLKNAVIGMTVALMAASCGMVEKPTVSGQQDGHDYVDLGLPSGKIWATCNIGANQPTEYGTYFAWGETSPKNQFEWENYKYSNGEAESRVKMTKYCSHSRKGEIDNKQVLELDDDAAAANWQGKWRTPTKEEWEELLNSCNWEWVKDYNHQGFDMKKGTSKANGNTIYFPFSGYYNGTTFVKNESEFWTVNQKTDNGLDAFYVRMLTHNQNVHNGPRKQGMAIRAVANK